MHTPHRESLLALCLLVSIASVLDVRAATAIVKAGQTATLTVTSNGTAPLLYQWYKNGTAIIGATRSSYAVSVRGTADAGNYTAKVSNLFGSTTSDIATLTYQSAPVITTQPVAQTVLAGTAVTFSVTATGAPAPTYQWRKNGVNITGATAASFTIASVATTNAGTFSVVVKNSVGSVTSAGALLTVTTRTQSALTTSTSSSSTTTTSSTLAITSQPSTVTVDAGQTATLSVAATGSGTLRYQWNRNGVAITGATAATYKILGAGLLDEANYTVKVSDTKGSILSRAVALNVNPALLPPALGADFNRDGYSDLLWQNRDNGAVTVRLMKGTSVLSSAGVGTATKGWEIEGTGDFDGDGGTDILWRNRSTGENLIWLMNGTKYQSSVKIATQSSAWRVAGVADFNDDGYSDIVWRNPSSTQNSVWLMTGSVVSRTSALPASSGGWEIRTAGDFNGDSWPDLVWYNTRDYSARVLKMTGLTPGSYFALGAASSNAAAVAGLADINDDGKSDLLWQTTTGQVVVWYVNGIGTSAKATVTTVAPEVTLRN